MAFSQSDLDALDQAIATGARSVHFQDRSVVYQSEDQMLKARTLIYLQLHPPGVSPAVNRQVRIFSGKGV